MTPVIEIRLFIIDCFIYVYKKNAKFHMVKYNHVVKLLMTYEMQKNLCKTCKNVRYCVRIDLDWYCDECYSWHVEYAEAKDKIRLTLTQFGMEDIEK